MQKKGIMGGTFDPVHKGHLALAACACQELGLEEVLFIPSKNPPHKMGRIVSPEKDRMRMVQLAIQGEDRFAFCGVELEREGMTYTVDTLSLLHKREPDTRWHFIMGADSLLEIGKWRNPGEILRLSALVAAVRDGSDQSVLERQRKDLENRFGGEIFLLSMDRIDISSTAIREAVRQEKDIREWVPEPVADYIKEQGLYC